MKINNILFYALFAASPVACAAAAPLGFDDARHLLNRTSFAANVGDIDAFARLTPPPWKNGGESV